MHRGDLPSSGGGSIGSYGNPYAMQQQQQQQEQMMGMVPVVGGRVELTSSMGGRMDLTSSTGGGGGVVGPSTVRRQSVSFVVVP